MEKSFSKSLAKIVFTLLLVCSLCSCASAPRVDQDFSVDELVGFYEKSDPLEIQDLFSQEKMIISKTVFNKKILINPETASLVNFADYKSPAILIEIDGSIKDDLTIQSYVIKSEKEPLYLFYPIITTLDKDRNRISEVLPEYEFKFKNNVLKNIFKLPMETRYILIHTSPKFTGMRFSESSPDSDGGINPAGAVVAGVLGGAVGGAIYGAIAYSESSDSEPSDVPDSFVFSIGGAISLRK